MRKNLFFLLICLAGFLSGWSQDSLARRVRILTKDGNEYVGKVVSEDSLAVQLATVALGKITIPRAGIKKQEILRDGLEKSGSYWEENRLAGKYFFASSAYNVRKGEGFYQNGLVLFNQVTYGLTDFWSISSGGIPLFLFNGGPTPLWVSTKFSVPVVKNKFNVGAGVVGGVVVGEDASFGLAYGNATFGSRDRNVTVLAGWGFTDGVFARTPSFSLSGMYRTSRRWYLLTENYYLDIDQESVVLLSVGARYLARNIGIDFGGALPLVEGAGFLMAPWLGVTVPFGGRKTTR